jgi:hypothetical protein
MAMNTTGPDRQRGFTMWQWLIILAIAGFFFTVGFKLAPLYITNFTVESTIDSFRTEPELATKSITEVRRAIERKFDVNMIDVVQAVCRFKDKPCLKIEKSKTTMVIDANYEARVHMMGNVDAIVVFDKNRIEIPIPGGT